MDKKLIINKTFEVLYDSNLVFSVKEFKTNLDEKLEDYEITVVENAIHEILKQLVSNDYLISNENESFVKGEKILVNPKNKQRYLLSTIINEYAKEFDADYLKETYIKSIKKAENTPADCEKYLEDSYEIIKNDLIKNKYIALNRNNQIDITQDL